MNATWLLLALALAAPAFAADAPAPAGAVSEVVVTGLPEAKGDTAYDVRVLDTQTLRASSSGRLDDVLFNVAGFQEYRRTDTRAANPTSQGATLRSLGGNASSRALVLLDGAPMQANDALGNHDGTDERRFRGPAQGVGGRRRGQPRLSDRRGGDERQGRRRGPVAVRPL